MQTSSTPGKESYNAVAIDTATRLHEARLAIRSQFEAEELPREKLFPPQNPAGLGVVLEYERMGNRPVTVELQARAETFGFEFEHPMPVFLLKPGQSFPGLIDDPIDGGQTIAVDRVVNETREALAGLQQLPLIHISEPTRSYATSYAGFSRKKKKKTNHINIKRDDTN